jgi:phosphoenolpyruvate carboxylase
MTSTATDTEPFLFLSPRFSGLSEPLCRDIELLDRVLGAVLAEQEGGDLLRLARRLFKDEAEGDPHTLHERIPELADPPTVKRLLRAFTTLFQLLNTAEQKEIVRVNRERQARTQAGAPRAESIAEAIERLQKSGVTAGEMQALLDNVFICPTLTAHPTEARRRAVQDKLQTIAQALPTCRCRPTCPFSTGPLDNAGRAEQRLRDALTALWQTDELRATPITVEDEARNALYFFERTILDVVTWLHADLRGALAEAYPDHAFHIPSFLRYRSWVGGDRDGNPNVTPEVTWHTLRSHRRLALQHYARRVEALRRELTQSTRIVNISDALRDSIEHDLQLVGLSDERRARFALEPYALKLILVAERLGATVEHLDQIADMASEGPGFATRPPAYADADAFLHDLRLLQHSLREHHAADLADEGNLAGLVIQAETFGFHLAALDIRQHSREHEKAMEDILHAAGVLAASTRYADLDEDAKTRILTRELLNPAPATWIGAPAAARRRRRAARLRRGPAGAQVSVAPVGQHLHHQHDARRERPVGADAPRQGGWPAALAHAPEGGDSILESDLDFVPLFETIDDLKGADALLRRLFHSRAYRTQLAARATSRRSCSATRIRARTAGIWRPTGPSMTPSRASPRCAAMRTCNCNSSTVGAARSGAAAGVRTGPS